LGATHQSIHRFFVLKLANVLRKVREMRLSLLLGCLATNRGGWSVKEISWVSVLAGIAMMWFENQR
jgi:hypothetical protein